MRITILLILFVCTFIKVKGQDAQFSQFYSAPLYLNPAFTGTSYNSRAIVNYRNQWPGAGKPFVSFASSFDHYFGKYNSGLGLMIMQNKEGISKLTSTEASLLYSYHVSLNEAWTFIPGLQTTFVSRSIDYSNITFPDQFDNSGLIGSTNENLNYFKKNYIDFSTGGLLFSEIFWFGAAYHHLNRPNQSLAANSSRLPGEINLHAGAKIPFASNPRGRSSRVEYKEKAFIPSILYKSQGNFDQLDLGVYMLYEPLIIGVWYRGLPVKKYTEGYTNSESIIGMIGWNYKNITFGYSYDFVVSSLTMRSAGAHEVSLTYVFGKEHERDGKKVKHKSLPCPGFYKKF
jgi:type IX secretion system PorP/SprF family membrane protein